MSPRRVLYAGLVLCLVLSACGPSRHARFARALDVASQANDRVTDVVIDLNEVPEGFDPVLSVEETNTVLTVNDVVADVIIDASATGVQLYQVEENIDSTALLDIHTLLATAMLAVDNAGQELAANSNAGTARAALLVLRATLDAVYQLAGQEVQ